jgi:hypothetical protein
MFFQYIFPRCTERGRERGVDGARELHREVKVRLKQVRARVGVLAMGMSSEDYIRRAFQKRIK